MRPRHVRALSVLTIGLVPAGAVATTIVDLRDPADAWVGVWLSIPVVFGLSSFLLLFPDDRLVST
jgi:hypothetical protein